MESLPPSTLMEIISTVVGVSSTFSEEQRIWKASARGRETKIATSQETVEEAISELSSAERGPGVSLLWPRKLEIYVREERSVWFQHSTLARGHAIELFDKTSGYSYRLGAPSDAFVAWRMQGFEKGPRVVLDEFMRLPYSPHFPTDLDGTIFDTLRFTLPELTITVSSKNQAPAERLVQLGDSALFQFAYNLNIACVPVTEFENLAERLSIPSDHRGVAAEDIEAPHVTYDRDLVHHYLLAVAANDPMVSFLSYYHIAEHFFEQIYGEEIVRQVRKKIQAPGFSSNRERDISQLVKLVSKLTREQREDAAPVNEQRALELVLAKYVSISDLMEAAGSLDQSAIDHYRNNKVDFSDGDAIPFGHADDSRITMLLAKRIYKTRNSIVHSKNNELPRYRPFHHTKSLHKEIPLLRSIAEAILIGSAQPIG